MPFPSPGIPALRAVRGGDLLIRWCYTASTDGMITGINNASSFGALTRVSSSPQSTAGTECTFVGSNAEQWRFHSEEVVSVKGDSNRGYDVDQERGRVSAGRPERGHAHAFVNRVALPCLHALGHNPTCISHPSTLPFLISSPRLSPSSTSPVITKAGSPVRIPIPQTPARHGAASCTRAQVIARRGRDEHRRGRNTTSNTAGGHAGGDPGGHAARRLAAGGEPDHPPREELGAPRPVWQGQETGVLGQGSSCVCGGESCSIAHPADGAES
jgi:hypothetical protein